MSGWVSIVCPLLSVLEWRKAYPSFWASAEEDNLPELSPVLIFHCYLKTSLQLNGLKQQSSVSWESQQAQWVFFTGSLRAKIERMPGWAPICSLWEEKPLTSPFRLWGDLCTLTWNDWCHHFLSGFQLAVTFSSESLHVHTSNFRPAIMYPFLLAPSISLWPTKEGSRR